MWWHTVASNTLLIKLVGVVVIFSVGEGHIYITEFDVCLAGIEIYHL